MKNLFIVLVVIAYFVWPIDLWPGVSIDDIAVIILGISAMKKAELVETEINDY